MSLNRREVLKSGAAGFLLGFLFRRRDGKLSEQPELAEQPPSAMTITTTPQRAFRAERLAIAGTVIGKRMVPEMEWAECAACVGDGCVLCDDVGGETVETGRMIEREVRHVPWLIEDLTIGARSQLAPGCPLPGDMFGADAVDQFVSLDDATEGQEIKITVRYTGDKPEGEPFFGALIGMSFDKDGRRTRAVLPISSGCNIVA